MGTALFGNHSFRGYEVLPSSSRSSLDMNRLMLGSWVRVSCNPLNGWYSSRHNLAVLGSRLSVCTIPNTQTDWHQGRIPLRSIVEEGLSLIDAAVLEDDAEESSEVESLPLEPGMDTPAVGQTLACYGGSWSTDSSSIRCGTRVRHETIWNYHVFITAI